VLFRSTVSVGFSATPKKRTLTELSDRAPHDSLINPNNWFFK